MGRCVCGHLEEDHGDSDDSLFYGACSIEDCACMAFEPEDEEDYDDGDDADDSAD